MAIISLLAILRANISRAIVLSVLLVLMNTGSFAIDSLDKSEQNPFRPQFNFYLYPAMNLGLMLSWGERYSRYFSENGIELKIVPQASQAGLIEKMLSAKQSIFFAPSIVSTYLIERGDLVPVAKMPYHSRLAVVALKNEVASQSQCYLVVGEYSNVWYRAKRWLVENNIGLDTKESRNLSGLVLDLVKGVCHRAFIPLVVLKGATNSIKERLTIESVIELGAGEVFIVGSSDLSPEKVLRIKQVLLSIDPQKDLYLPKSPLFIEAKALSVADLVEYSNKYHPYTQQIENQLDRLEAIPKKY